MKEITVGDLESVWRILPEELKRRRVEKAHRILRDVYITQLKKLKELEMSMEGKEEDYHTYVFKTVENFWDNARLAFLMGKKKSLKNYTFYPARTVYETFLRFNYFANQSEANREIIYRKELLRALFVIHKREVREGSAKVAKIQKEYDRISTGMKIEKIDKIKKCSLNPFPDIMSLILDTNIKKPENFYTIYEMLCEANHGKIIAIAMRQQSVKYEDYRRSIMIIVNCGQEMLELVDNNFNDSKLKDRIADCNIRIGKAMAKELTIEEKKYINPF